MATDDEKRQRLGAGEPLRFPPWPEKGKEWAEDTAARTIKAEWLNELAAIPHRVVRVPLNLQNAFIEGDLNLQYATFEHEVFFVRCRFAGPVNFSFANFKRTVGFNGSRFDQEANLRAARAVGDFDIRRATFIAPATFMDLHVDEVLDATRARFSSADFQRIEVAKNAFFRRATSDGETQFQGAHIRGSADFDGAEFKGKASFDRVQIDGDAYFSTDESGNRVEFGAEANFHGAHIGADADFSGAHFKGQATFDGIQIDVRALFSTDESGNRAEFRAEARFLGAHVHGDASFIGAQFKCEASFDGILIDGSAFFRADERGNRVAFGAEARFVDVRIGGDAEFDGAQFKGEASFDRIQIGGSAFFRPARHKGELIPVQFGGAASFPAAVFASDVQFIRAEFQGAVDFDNVHFQGGTYFKAAVFGPPETEGKKVQAQKPKPEEASFRGAHFERVVSFERARFQVPADFTAVSADRDALFMGTVFEDAVTFREARFQSAQFRHVLVRNVPIGEEPQFHKKVDLRGFTYDRIYVGWEDLLKRIEYDRQPYAQLERTLRSTGLDREADAVYYEQRRRGGNNIPPNSFLSWLWDRTYRYLAGYGVRVWPLVLTPILLIALGAFVFHHYGALAEKPETTPQARLFRAAASPCLNKPGLFDAFSVSLRLLIRLEVPSASKCVPSENEIAPWMRIKYSTYGTIHMLLGWLLVPFAVASIASRLGRRGTT